MDVIDIADLRKQFVEKTKVKDLKDFAQTQQNLLEKVLFENRALKEKNEQLETILNQLADKKNVVMNISAEELICIEQIQILRSKSANRELDLDEVKRLDILIKNLRLIRDQSTQAIDTVGYRDVSEAELVAIATGKSE